MKTACSILLACWSQSLPPTAIACRSISGTTAALCSSLTRSAGTALLPPRPRVVKKGHAQRPKWNWWHCPFGMSLISGQTSSIPSIIVSKAMLDWARIQMSEAAHVYVYDTFSLQSVHNLCTVHEGICEQRYRSMTDHSLFRDLARALLPFDSSPSK